VPRLPRLSLTRVVILLAVGVVGYLLFSAVGDTLLSLRLSSDQQRLEQQISDLRQQHDRLQEIRDYLQTDAYIEGVARRVLGLVRPGETLVIVSSNVTPAPAATPGADAKTDTQSWWERLYGQ
jgi:cell division protein FtsB